MPHTRRIKPKSSPGQQQASDDPFEYTEEEIYALVASCEQDFPEIGKESLPSKSLQPVKPPPPAPVNLSLEISQAQRVKIDQDATKLKEATGACYLYGSLTSLFGPQIECTAYGVYLDRLIREAGNPTDPLERMLLEQLAIAHHNIGRLHVKAAISSTLSEAAAYNTAASRLMAEFRRSSLALKTYRAPASPSHLTVVQQNHAPGNQQLALVDGHKDQPVALPEARKSQPLALPAGRKGQAADDHFRLLDNKQEGSTDGQSAR